jgi:polyisoprenoid-binding protein YceI
MKMTILFVAALLAVASPAAATELQIELDPERTTVGFTLKATLHSVHGGGFTASGSLLLDTETDFMSGDITVDATGAETGNKKRDKKMHAKVLRTAEHPRIVLHPRRLEGALAPEGRSDVVVVGDMEILGESHEVRIPLQVEIEENRFEASGAFEIPYVDWGLEDPSTFILWVAKVVNVTVEAAGDVTIAESPGAHAPG